MTDLSVLRGLGYLIVAAAVAALVSRPARVPTLVAYIAAGLVLGPVTGLVAFTHSLEVIAEIGIALLLFLVGLELTVEKIRDVGRVAVLAGAGQVSLSAAAGFALALAFGFGARDALFIGIALMFSSTVVVVKLLKEKGELDSLYGRIAVGILLVQDLVVIVVLTLVAGLGGQESLSAGSIAGGLARAFGGMLLLLGAAVLAARKLLPTAFRWIARAPDALLVWSLAWCFLFVVAAETLHLSPEIGAFLAGVAIAQLPYAHDLRRRVGPLTSFFIAVFFLALGLRMDPGAALGLWLPAIGFSLFVLLARPFLFLWMIARSGYGRRVSVLTSLTMAQTSEFSMVLATLAAGAGLIGEELLALVAVVGLATISVSSYMVLHSHRLYDLLERRGLLRRLRAGRPGEEDDEGEPPLRDHVIVVGMNALGRRIVEALEGRGDTVVAIDADPAALARLRCRTVAGKAEHLSVLEEAGLPEARLLVSALRIEEANRLLAHHAARLGVPTSLHAFHADAAHELHDAGATHLMLPREDGTRRLLELLAEEGVVPR